MIRARASLVSLGGVVLAGLFLVLFTILWTATHLPTRHVWLEWMFVMFCLGMTVYVVDGASESLVLQDDTLTFDGWFTRRRSVSLVGVTQVLLVHEGLNSEWGIETLTFQRGRDTRDRLPLGPLWRRRDLEAFLTQLGTVLHDQKIVEEVR